MPNGITADIYEGKDVSLRDYLMLVGRQMGFAVMQLDDAFDAPVREVEPSDYHAKAVAHAQAELARLDALTIDEASREAQEEYERDAGRWDEAKHNKLALRARYEAMIEKVEAWDVPAILASTKEHALRYLRESIDFDCGQPGEEMRFYNYPKRLSGAEWLNAKRERARHDVDYHRDEHAKELKRTAERNDYIRAFLGSLPAPALQGERA